MATLQSSQQEHRQKYIIRLAELKGSKDIANDFNCWNLGKNALIGDGHIMTVTILATNYKSCSKITTDRYPKKEIMILRTKIYGMMLQI